MKKKDIILIVTLLVIAVSGIFGYQVLYGQEKPKGPEAVVLIHGKEYGRYPLNVDQEVEIKADYGTSTLKIKDGQCEMTHAGCPDQICVHHAPISKEYDMIICIPNEMIIKVDNGEESETDSVAQ